MFLAAHSEAAHRHKNTLNKLSETRKHKRTEALTQKQDREKNKWINPKASNVSYYRQT